MFVLQVPRDLHNVSGSVPTRVRLREEEAAEGDTLEGGKGVDGHCIVAFRGFLYEMSCSPH